MTVWAWARVPLEATVTPAEFVTDRELSSISTAPAASALRRLAARMISPASAARSSAEPSAVASS